MRIITPVITRLRLSSCFNGFDSTKQVNSLPIHGRLNIWIHRALYNRVIPPPILGAFYNNKKNILFIDIEQVISQ